MTPAVTPAGTPAQEFAAFAARTAAEGAPDALRDDLVARTADLLGNCLAARDAEPARVTAAVVAEWGGTPRGDVTRPTGAGSRPRRRPW